ncbi:hypothetical protein BGZ76_001463 [Entomortierella beljakovae]|nr:hypothetical protein BGZ76_001463 [Entomortierella beljakovae]
MDTARASKKFNEFYSELKLHLENSRRVLEEKVINGTSYSTNNNKRTGGGGGAVTLQTYTSSLSQIIQPDHDTELEHIVSIAENHQETLINVVEEISTLIAI